MFQRNALGVAGRAVATLVVPTLIASALMITTASSAQADDRHIDPSSLETLQAQVWCSAGKGTVVISTHNSLPAVSDVDNSLSVTARLGDAPDAPTDGPFVMNPGSYHTFVVPTGMAQVPAGHITFIQTWADGSGYNDERGVAYAAKDCRFPVSPVVDTVRSATCANPDLIVKGADYFPGLTWDPAGAVTLAQGEAVTFSAIIDETISRQAGGVSSVTITNDFVCLRPYGRIWRNHGNPWARLNNSWSDGAVRYHVWAFKRRTGQVLFDATYSVGAGKARQISLGGDRRFHGGTVIKIRANNKLLDRVRFHHD